VFNNQGLPVTCINRAAGNGEHIRLVYEAPSNGKGPNQGMRSVRTCNPWEEGAQESFKIDSLKLKKCAFMKIDCEGSEIETLLGAAETIKRCKPILFVEAFRGGQEWRGHTIDQLKATIESFHYAVEIIGEEPRWDWLARPL
jgi:FkbM family methyltransferase